MAVILGRHVSLQMFALWAVEAALAFALIYALLGAEAASGVPQDHAANNALALALTVSGTALTIGLYRPEVLHRTRRLLLDTGLAGVIAFPAVLLVSHLLGLSAGSPLDYDTLWPLKLLTAWIGLLFATRIALRAAVRLHLVTRRVLVLDPDGGQATAAALRIQRDGLLELAGTASALPSFARLRRARVNEVVLGNGVELSAADTALLEDAGIEVRSATWFWERRLRRVDIDQIPSEWFEAVAEPSRGGIAARVFDILVSLGLLVLTLPLMLLTALLIRLDSPGPVLYRQERVGLGGVTFTLLKFRSMRADAEMRGPTWAQAKDPRVTRVGQFIRKVRIDELPQLLNVLRGEMSFVGPRPERSHFVEQLAAAIPNYRKRSLVKPGVTGWAQVNYPYGASIEDARMKLSYDLYYVRNRSLLLDILILVATIRVIVFQEGAR
ncbi:MAG: exopolysaccharide biosynthesis polyprenyl glycosylphosphotransferase [Acetobacteraceae bacterium]|nr:exopolysaccharide biosynthesis polyprenyl glycosylphosphotransferase [Acetobacteraceae bacterium]